MHIFLCIFVFKKFKCNNVFLFLQSQESKIVLVPILVQVVNILLDIRHGVAESSGLAHLGQFILPGPLERLNVVLLNPGTVKC